MAKPSPGTEGPDRAGTQPERHAGTGGQADKLKDMQAKLQDTPRHHPAGLEEQAKRAEDVELRIAHRIEPGA